MMSISNKSGFKGMITALALLFILTQVNAQSYVIKTHSGPKGIWVLCGNQLPKGFVYRILRQKNKDVWVKLADLSFPESKEEVQGRMLDAQQSAGHDVSALSDVRLNAVWDRFTDPLAADLPLEMKDNYPLQQAGGTAWFDAGSDSIASYIYKVQWIGSKDEVIRESVSAQASYPGKRPEANLIPLSVKAIAGGSVIAEFAVSDQGNMTACKVFRSYYLRSGFEEIQAEPIFLKRDSTLILQFTDKTAIEKVPYVYVVRPVDAAGNIGSPSSELRFFNVADHSIIPSVTNFRTTSVEQEKAIKLSWELKDSKDVISIDIFKGAEYDGEYIKIASVSPKDTTYFDHYANPVETYFYTIRLNGTYEQSPSAPRIPGILKASNINHFPPQNLRLVQHKNMVNLSWERTENDTRAYYVYRSIGKTYKMEQIGPVIISDSAYVTYTDTIPPTAEAGVYAYAVADQNTSYAISKITAPVFAHYQGMNALPIPHDLAVTQLKPGIIQVVWPNMRTESPYIQGYMLYRRAKSIGGKETEPLKPMSAKVLDVIANNYIDSTAKEGMIYYYSLRTVADDEQTMSSASLETGITIRPALISTAANVRVSPSGKSVSVKWDKPLGEDLKSVRLIRSTEGGEEAKEIAALDAATEVYTDTQVTAGQTYYYQLQMETKQGKKSRLTDPVGIKIYK